VAGRCFDVASNANFELKMRPDSETSMSGPGRKVQASPLDTPRGEPLHSRVMRVQNFALFLDISPQDCSQIVGNARERLFSRGQVIYLEGDDVRQVVLLTSGCVKIVHCSQDGSAVILRLCGPGELVGTLRPSIQARYRFTPQALTPSSALVWDSAVFESLSKRFPSLRLNVAYILYKQLEDMEDRFREISTESVVPRLGHQILRLVEQVGVRSSSSVEINITREELAQMIGASLFTVSRLLSEWDRQGIVTTRRRGLSIGNLKALSELID
jgi:CRP-like cAMP-binding protein